MSGITEHDVYPTLGEAEKSVRRLGIRSRAVYKANRHLDPRLPEHPEIFYADDWAGERNFFGPIPAKYATLVEAKSAARELGFRSSSEYFCGYWVDQKLPQSPNINYRNEWVSWLDFLGKTVSKYYTYNAAKNTARRLGIISSTDYVSRYSGDPMLPPRPDRFYQKSWVSWNSFLGRVERYKSFEEARDAVRKLNFRTSTEYFARYKEDIQLPRSPEHCYKKEWVGWPDFLGGSKYSTLNEVLEVIKSMGVKTRREYLDRRSLDPRLPADPKKFFEDWPGWSMVLKNVKPPNKSTKYSSLDEAAVAARNLSCLSRTDYVKKYKCDQKLPSHPEYTYKYEWKGYPSFLGVEQRKPYDNIESAMDSCNDLRIFSRADYLERRFLDPRLAAHPELRYEEKWPGWTKFFLPRAYLCLDDVKLAVKVLGIKDSKDYRVLYKNGEVPLPSHPERMFSDDWISWFDLCERIPFYNYEEARRVVTLAGVTTRAEYKEYIKKSSDPWLPRSPEEVYGDDWVDWFSFLDKEPPFIIDHIGTEYGAWRKSISEFFKGVKGGKHKHSHLCRFLRHFVQLQGNERSPQALLVSKNVNINAYKSFLNSLKPSTSRGLNWAVVEFCNFILNEKMTSEDEETGELIRVPGARNPFLLRPEELEVRDRRGETTKCALAYQYVDAAKRWLVPQRAKTFADMTHLHWFETDWIEIDPSILDSNDPDCVFKEEKGKIKIWCPIYWMHAFALMSVPARGRQLAYNDSGEGDSRIPVIRGDGLVWEDNSNTLRGLNDNQGFVKYYAGDEFGMYFTTNKTSAYGQGYSVPWIPMDLAYWLVRLREWQNKYNPVLRPMPWIECERTNLNEPQRLAKGANFFLFREFGQEDPGIFGARLTDRLAVALYHSQPRKLSLATCNGNPKKLSNYQSKYTPHSMRVSLITAYVLEFGLSVEIVMKIAGHASIVMSIYYVKIGQPLLRTRFNEGEKRALKDKAFAAQRMIEQNRIESIKDELIANDALAITALVEQRSVGSQLFRDYGICPFGGSRCEDGGQRIGKTLIHGSVPAGYMGSQNCPRCRHFVTGPVFVGGLLSLFNEISLQARYQSRKYECLEGDIAGLRGEIDSFDAEEYLANKACVEFDSEERDLAEIRTRKLKSELESAAKKLDMLLCDIQAIGVLIRQCEALANKKTVVNEVCSKPQLILQKENELSLSFEEVSVFQQLSEVCENAEIYESASADLAIAPRSQILDKMMVANNLAPRMFNLTSVQQLRVGNQLVNLFMSRLKFWSKVDDVVDGRCLLSELDRDSSISNEEFNALFKSAEPIRLGDSI